MSFSLAYFESLLSLSSEELRDPFSLSVICLLIEEEDAEAKVSEDYCEKLQRVEREDLGTGRLGQPSFSFFSTEFAIY